MSTQGAIENGEYIRSGSRLSVCRIDCCTFAVEIEGCLTVFDPWLNDPARFAPLWNSVHLEPPVVRTLPEADLVFVSQNAPDHCDLEAMASLPRSTTIIAPSDAEPSLRSLGFGVVAMDAPSTQSIGPLRVTAIPAEHPGVLKQNAYLLEGKHTSVLVIADPAATAPLLGALAALPSPPDALLLAATGFTLRYFGRIVMLPEEGAQLAARVGAPYVFPTRSLMHEGVRGLLGRLLVKSFVKPDESYHRFLAEFTRLAPEASSIRLDRGERWNLEHAESVANSGAAGHA